MMDLPRAEPLMPPGFQPIAERLRIGIKEMEHEVGQVFFLSRKWCDGILPSLTDGRMPSVRMGIGQVENLSYDFRTSSILRRTSPLANASRNATMSEYSAWLRNFTAQLWAKGLMVITAFPWR